MSMNTDLPAVCLMRYEASPALVALLGLALMLLMNASPALAQAQATSSTRDAEPPTRIELYTMGPGEHFFALYGHSAMCVFVDDDDSRNDRCYDYGTTMSSDHFKLFWDVTRGRPIFQIRALSYREFLRDYKRENRAVYKQPLPLSVEQTHKLHERLREDARPENSRFIYHHFKDNCSTRLRNRLDFITEGRFGEATRAEEAGSLRQYVRQGFGTGLHLLVASELWMGRVIDEPLDVWGSMFTPGNLREQVEAHFGVEPVVVIEREGPPLKNYADEVLWCLLGMALGLGAPLAAGAWFGGPSGRRRSLIAAAALMTLLALPGWALALISTEPEVRLNEVLLVLVPLDLFLLRDSWRRHYLLARLTILALVVILALTGLFIQPLTGPVVISLALLSPAIILTWRQPPDDAT